MLLQIFNLLLTSINVDFLFIQTLPFLIHCRSLVLDAVPDASLIGSLRLSYGRPRPTGLTNFRNAVKRPNLLGIREALVLIRASFSASRDQLQRPMRSSPSVIFCSLGV